MSTAGPPQGARPPGGAARSDARGETNTGPAQAAVRFHICERGARGAGHGEQEPAWIGPGKIALLEAIARTGSITAAARELGMSYRRAWLLVEETNRCLASPAVQTAAGGQRGGGTALTPVGLELCTRYRSIERSVEKAVTRDLAPILKGGAQLTAPKKGRG